MRTLAVKTLELNRKIDILFRRATADRLKAYLCAVAKEKGTCEFDIPLDRQGLADYLCVERSALSAEISRLSRAGVISAHKRHFILQNLNGVHDCTPVFQGTMSRVSRTSGIGPNTSFHKHRRKREEDR